LTKLRGLFLALNAAFIVGCATEPLLLPDAGPTSLEVFHGQSSESISDGRVNHATYTTYRPEIQSYTRTATSEIDNLFPQVPNQVLTGFVYPHLGSTGHPIPSYSTAFPLYEQTHFAQPGEVPILPYRDHTQ